MHPDIRRLIREAIRGLCNNPQLGDPLKRELKGLWKYRVRRYRIVYAVDPARQELRIYAVGHRESIYDSLIFHAK